MLNCNFQVKGFFRSFVTFDDLDKDPGIRCYSKITALFFRCFFSFVTVQTKQGSLYLDQASFTAWKAKHKISDKEFKNSAAYINFVCAKIFKQKAKAAFKEKNYLKAIEHLKTANARCPNAKWQRQLETVEKCCRAAALLQNKLPEVIKGVEKAKAVIKPCYTQAYETLDKIEQHVKVMMAKEECSEEIIEFFKTINVEWPSEQDLLSIVLSRKRGTIGYRVADAIHDEYRNLTFTNRIYSRLEDHSDLLKQDYNAAKQQYQKHLQAMNQALEQLDLKNAQAALEQARKLESFDDVWKTDNKRMQGILENINSFIRDHLNKKENIQSVKAKFEQLEKQLSQRFQGLTDSPLYKILIEEIDKLKKLFAQVEGKSLEQLVQVDVIIDPVFEPFWSTHLLRTYQKNTKTSLAVAIDKVAQDYVLVAIKGKVELVEKQVEAVATCAQQDRLADEALQKDDYAQAVTTLRQPPVASQASKEYIKKKCGLIEKLATWALTLETQEKLERFNTETLSDMMTLLKQKKIVPLWKHVTILFTNRLKAAGAMALNLTPKPDEADFYSNCMQCNLRERYLNLLNRKRLKEASWEFELIKYELTQTQNALEMEAQAYALMEESFDLASQKMLIAHKFSKLETETQRYLLIFKFLETVSDNTLEVVSKEFNSERDKLKQLVAIHSKMEHLELFQQLLKIIDSTSSSESPEPRTFKTTVESLSQVAVNLKNEKINKMVENASEVLNAISLSRGIDKFKRIYFLMVLNEFLLELTTSISKSLNLPQNTATVKARKKKRDLIQKTVR